MAGKAPPSCQAIPAVLQTGRRPIVTLNQLLLAPSPCCRKLQMFHPFEPQSKTQKFRRNLPHWRQNGVTYFVTTRLADSIPQNVIIQWMSDRKTWLRANGFESKDDLTQATELQRAEYHRRFTVEWHRLLDLGAGSCLLSDSANAAMVGESLRYFDGVKYGLDSFVVMPNHVHLLLTPADDFDLSDIMRGWKGYTARIINQRSGGSGRLWMTESFNHIVRSEAQFQRFQRYIADNPVKARLPQGSYLYWRKETK